MSTRPVLLALILLDGDSYGLAARLVGVLAHVFFMVAGKRTEAAAGPGLGALPL